MATINKPNVNIHVSISSVTIFIPPYAGSKPPIAMYTTVAALQYIFYHKPCQKSTIFGIFYYIM